MKFHGLVASLPVDATAFRRVNSVKMMYHGLGSYDGSHA